MEPNQKFASQKSAKSILNAGVTAIDTTRRSPGASRPEPLAARKDTLFTRLLRWLFPDQRKTRRHAYPPIISYLGAAHVTHPYQIADIGVSGFFMVTVERWLPGTKMPVTLRRTDKHGKGSDTYLTLLSTVVHTGPTGVGFSFVLTEGCNSDGMQRESDNAILYPQSYATRKQAEKFLEGLDLSEAEELVQAS